jgi:hypothetical protein
MNIITHRSETLLVLDHVSAIFRKDDGDAFYTVLLTSGSEIRVDDQSGRRLLKRMELASRPLPIRLGRQFRDYLAKRFNHVLGRQGVVGGPPGVVGGS